MGSNDDHKMDADAKIIFDGEDKKAEYMKIYQDKKTLSSQFQHLYSIEMSKHCLVNKYYFHKNHPNKILYGKK